MGVGVVVQLLQPAINTVVGKVFGDVIDQQGSNSTSVIPVWKRLTMTLYVTFRCLFVGVELVEKLKQRDIQ